MERWLRWPLNRSTCCFVKAAVVRCIGLGVIGLLGAAVPASSLWAEELAAQEWKIAVPWRSPGRTGTPALFAQELTKELQVPVQVEASAEGLLEQTLAWSLANAKTQPSLVLLSDELVQTVGEDDPSNPRNLSHYEPLVLMWQTRWCLFTKAATEPKEPKALMDALSAQPALPHIAIPEEGGRMSVWVRGVEQRTRRKWRVSAYGLRGSVAQALQAGADVALGYCSRQKTHPQQTRILFQSGDTHAQTMPDVPLSYESGWMPLDHGWIAWATPKAVAAAQREKMAVALYRVMGTVPVKERLAGAGHVFDHWTPQQSREHIEKVTRAWHAVSNFLDRVELHEVERERMER